MEHKQLLSLVAAILSTRPNTDLDTSVKDAEELVKIVDSEKHAPKSGGDRNAFRK